MSSGELLLIFLVAMLVFGPSKLPMLAHHLGQLIKCLNHYKRQASVFWQSQLNEHTLQENIIKAEKADKQYPADKVTPEKE